jgi:multicomponent K+:H+ antiporter subunit G
MTVIVEIILALLLVVAGIFGLVGSFGLVKLSDPMRRLHAPTKATTLGVGGVLIASMGYFAFLGSGVTWHELMITLFLFLTAPITAHFIAKAFLHRNIPADELPPSASGAPWAGHDTDERAAPKDEATR